MTHYLWMLGTFVSSSLLAQQDSLAIPRGVMIASGLSGAFVAKFSLFIAIVLLWTIAIGKLLQWLTRCPEIAGQIIAGIILGPSFIDIAGLSLFAEPFSVIDNATGILYSLASSDLFIFFILLLSAALTVSYLLWIAGHETDIRDIIKVGVTAVSAGVLGAVLPIIFNYAIVYFFFADSFSLVQSVGLGLVFSATSVSIPVAMLFAQGKMHLQSSKATLGAAIIDDIVAVVLLSFFFISLQSGSFGVVKGLASLHHATIGQAVFSMLFAMTVLFLVGYYCVPRAIRKLKEPSSSYLIASVANGIMLLYSAFSEIVGGLAGVTGAYFAGLFHRMGDDQHQAERVISPYLHAVLLPLFLGSIGLQVDISVLNKQAWIMVAVLLLGAIISKMVACYAAAELSNVSRRRKTHRWSLLDAYLFGSSMIARGEVGLVISTILRSSQVIDAEQYIIAVVVIILSTIVAPLMLSIGFAYLDEKPQVGQLEEYEHVLGHFSTIGTDQFFNIIIGIIEATGAYRTTVSLSGGHKVADLEGQNVKVIKGSDGILFKGNKHNIDQLLQLVKQSIKTDLEQIR